MKKISALFIVSICFLACQEDNMICIDPNLMNSTYECDSIYEPVCGCDNKTYFNHCEAELKGGLLSWTEGACDTDCEFNDTVLVFSTDQNCTLLQNSSSELFEVITEAQDFNWILGEYYLINKSPSIEDGICMIGTPINVECITLFNLNPNCVDIHSISGEDNQLPNDTLEIISTVLSDDCLLISYNYLGGCDPSRIDLYHLIDSSDHFQTRLQIRYDNGNGPCTDPFTDSVSFDLSTLQLPDQTSINIKLDCNGDANFYQEFTYQYESN